MLVSEEKARKFACPQALSGGNTPTYFCLGGMCLAWRWAENRTWTGLDPCVTPSNLENGLSLTDATKKGYCGMGGPP